jgi:uncharacterized tellurite resistance protein B-like protein
MIDVVKRFFSKATTQVSRGANQNTGHDIRVATCALFVEIARIDEKFTAAEMATILSILKHADALIAEAERELEKSVDLWQFTRLINENYTNEEKIKIIETLWQIVYVDGKMDQYEHYLMNKLQNLLRLTHDQLITAKLKVLHSEK